MSALDSSIAEIRTRGGTIGTEEENLTAWIKSGVLCVGMGSKLFPKDVVAAGNWQAITDKCVEALGYIAKARG